MKVSIITPCLNRKEMIGTAIESVLAQRYSEFEHWIIDGGSTDGTVDFLKKYPHLKVISEPDRGVYDGFNKGVDRATGDVVAFLNSDDLYAPGTFDLVKGGFDRASTEVITGGCEIFRRMPSGSEVIMHRYVDARRYQLSVRGVTLGVPNINARFFRRSVFEKIGNFSLEYKMAADREFLLRSALAGISDYPIEKLFYRYRWHSGSLTMNAGNTTLLTAIQESLKITNEYGNLASVGTRDRATLKAWRRELQATLFMIHTLQRKPGAAFAGARASLEEDPRWIFDLFRCGAQSVGRRLRTFFRSVIADVGNS
jgi:glycosyltransferase involved in cell wall biosynthesis